MPPKRYEQEPRDNRQSFGLITNNRASSAIGNEGMNTTYEGSDWQLNQTVVVMLPYEKKVVSSSMKQHVSKVGGQSFLAFKRDYRRLN